MSYCGGTSGVMLVMALGLKRPCWGLISAIGPF